MYKVYYEGMPFASVPDIETACALALSVHRSSNEPHTVRVFDSVHEESVLNFYLEGKSKVTK